LTGNIRKGRLSKFHEIMAISALALDTGKTTEI
jgi:hypothetical protein